MISREHILEEIKRTARESGGGPLGWRKFKSETGIGEYDWQRYWPRFSDAQRAAGFEPNTKNAAFDDQKLIARFIELIREVDRWPSRGDLRVKRHADPTFPNEKVFRKFGVKVKSAEKLLAYCADKKGYSDVVKVLADIVERGSEKDSTENVVEASAGLGFIYLLKSGRYYKIGRTNAVGRRERELAIQMPEKANVVHSIKTDDPIGIEAYWHRRFETKRKNGEWFNLDRNDLVAFRRRKFM